jgi:outer membrane protein
MIRIRSAQLALILVAAMVGSASAAEVKIGVVVIEKLMQDSPQGKSVAGMLKNEFEARQRDLESQRKDLQVREEKLNRDRAVMSDQERGDLEEQLRSRQQKFQRMASEYEDDVNAAKNKLQGSLLRLIQREVQTYGKEAGYDLVIANSTVFWASPSTDVTPMVLKRLEALAATNAAPGAAAAPKAPVDPTKTPPKK